MFKIAQQLRLMPPDEQSDMNAMQQESRTEFAGQVCEYMANTLVILQVTINNICTTNGWVRMS